MTDRQKIGRLFARAVALAALIVALGAAAPRASAAGEDPYSLQAEALFGEAGTDLMLRVGGPSRRTLLDKVQVKAWPSGGGEAETWNFFDVIPREGAPALSLPGVARGDRLQIRAHVKDGRQHNLEAYTTVLRRPDLALTQIDVPADIVRTRAFEVAATVAEVGGDVGADARVTLYDGPSAVADTAVTVGPGATSTATFRIILARPRAHTLRAVVADAAPAEWDVAPNASLQEVYVNHYGENGVVATDHPLATQVGVDVLENGGNAFDAAAAVQFALNVTQPHLSGIGGGSNVLVRLETGEVFAIDARETAPAATTPTTYGGLPAAQVRPNGYAAGVPGTLRAAEYLLDRWGTRTLADALQPAIALAENGFPIGTHLANDIASQRGFFQPETGAIFLTTDGQPRPKGATLSQPDLANTFRLIARDGTSAFYEGEIAEAIVAAQRRATAPGREGLMTLADLSGYAIEVESPLSLRYGDYEVLAPGPSTNGGVVLLESLGLMREFLNDPRNDGYAWGFGTRNSLHVFLEAMRLSFADRDWWIGDERFSSVPAARLLGDGYLFDRSRLIQGETVMCGSPPPGNPFPYPEPTSAVEVEAGVDEAGHTTHFSIIDRWGNAVVMTSTLADSFGTGITVPGYGFLLNDSLRLFNLSPTANTATGNPGANDAAGGKRPMGSMTPTLILRDGEPFAGLGSFGASFIPSVVLNVVLNLIEYDMPLQHAVEAPRMWTQLATGDAQLNLGFASLIEPLRAMGHRSAAFGGCAGNVNRTPLGPPAFGSTGSFSVELENFSLVRGEDSARLPDATTVVVERT